MCCFLYFCAVIAITERGGRMDNSRIYPVCARKHVFMQDEAEMHSLCLPVPCSLCTSDGRGRKQEGKNKNSSSLFPWSLCIESLASLTSDVCDGNAFLRQVWDSRRVKRGLGRSQWSRPILTRRRNSIRATKGSSDLLFFFSSHVLHLTGYPPGEPEPSRNWRVTACVLLGCQSHLTPVALKNKRPYNKVLHFGALLKRSAVCRAAFQSLPFLFPPADRVTRAIDKARRLPRGRFDDGRSFLNAALRPMWNPTRLALRRLILRWLTGWCQKDNKQMESPLIGWDLFMALRSGAQLICLPLKGAWPLNKRSSSGGTELFTWWIGDLFSLLLCYL